MTTGWGSLAVGAGFGYAALDTAATTEDITGDVVNIHTDAGRDSPFDPFPMGTCDIVLDNTSRKYDPANAAGPYFGELKAFRQIVVKANDSTSTPNNLFTGFICPPPDGYAFDYPEDRDATVTLHCVDAFVFLDAAKFLGLSLPSDLSGNCIVDVLFSAGWPLTWIDIDGGQTLLDAVTWSGSALEYIRLAEQSEFGAFYIDPSNGFATFDDRHAVLKNSRMTTSQATFSDSGTDVDFDVVAWALGAEVRNHWRIGTSPDTAQEASDATSILDNGDQLYEALNLIMQNDPEAYARAEFGVKAYKDALYAPSVIQINPTDSNAALDQALRRRLRDRSHQTWTPPGGGAANAQDVFIERIVHDIPVRDTPNDWTTQFSLSSADRFGFADYTQFLKLDDASLGKLDAARLAY